MLENPALDEKLVPQVFEVGDRLVGTRNPRWKGTVTRVVPQFAFGEPAGVMYEVTWDEETVKRYRTGGGKPRGSGRTSLLSGHTTMRKVGAMNASFGGSGLF